MEGLGEFELQDPDIGRRLEQNQFIEKHLRHESNDVCGLTLRLTAMTKPELQEMRLCSAHGTEVCPMAGA